MPILPEPLEDSPADILHKAMHGLKLSPIELAKKSQLSLEKVEALLSGRGDELSLQLAAKTLLLHPESLVSLYRNEYHPIVPLLPNSWSRFQTSFLGGRVNSYLVWDAATRLAAAFDT